MQVTRTRVPLVATVLVGIAVMTPGIGTATGFGRSGVLRVEKECSGFNGQPGSYCAVVTANIPEIPKDAKIRYGQPEGVPGFGLDSNVVLDAGDGNLAIGRCTLGVDVGLCTFSDGTGRLAGFNARVEVTTVDGVTWYWNGTYEFTKVGPWPRPGRW